MFSTLFCALYVGTVAVFDPPVLTRPINGYIHVNKHFVDDDYYHYILEPPPPPPHHPKSPYPKQNPISDYGQEKQKYENNFRRWCILQ